MTPFGETLRELRAKRGLNQAQLAIKLGVSAAYLSALEHGKRSAPSFEFVQQIIEFFGLIWDDAERLIEAAELSKPKVSIDTAGLDPKATLLANKLARSIHRLDDRKLNAILAIIDEQPSR